MDDTAVPLAQMTSHEVIDYTIEGVTLESLTRAVSLFQKTPEKNDEIIYMWLTEVALADFAQTLKQNILLRKVLPILEGMGGRGGTHSTLVAINPQEVEIEERLPVSPTRVIFFPNEFAGKEPAPIHQLRSDGNIVIPPKFAGDAGGFVQRFSEELVKKMELATLISQEKIQAKARFIAEKVLVGFEEERFKETFNLLLRFFEMLPYIAKTHSPF